MATPLYKRMKKGTSFYAFPNAIQDMNLVNMNDKFKMTFSKYVLLNIPEQEIVIDSGAGINRDQEKGVLNFDKDMAGPRFFNFQPGKNSDLPVKFSEQLIESLRNYVANYDTSLREARINSNTDFYNVNEITTSTEMIFWKWCRKLNLIDFEPAEHKIDWDKNLPDFDNEKGSNNSYFRNYLWKERDINNYDCMIYVDTVDNKTKIEIDGIAKFKENDTINFEGDNETIITGNISGGTDYILTSIIYDQPTNKSTIEIADAFATVGIETDSVIFLKYHRLVESIGEVQAVSQVQTSRHNFTDVSIQIPAHAGSTPTILFHLNDNTNYYPGLEMPIMPLEQQVEINGSENTNSPLRLNPENYPGTYYGYYDTVDKTYKCTSGDRARLSGDYYGINLTNNLGLDNENYIEKLEDFNSNKIDGMKIDFDQNHYLKMNLPEYLIRNFDEFNSAYFDKPPTDYFFNAILWYYDLDNGSGKIVSNLFGIEFLNDPGDDMDGCDIDSNLITPYRKLVSNGEQDGYSYIFDFNLNVNIDNDVLPLSYDPTTVNNQFGFDLYQNILNSNAQIQESFLTIVNGYTQIQEDLYDIRSLVMSDTDMTKISGRLDNLDELLTLYSTMQMVDSDTVSLETLYTGAYPTMKMNVIQTLYENIINVNITDVYKYNDINAATYVIPITRKNMTRVNIWNENNNYNEDTTILINQDLKYKQAMEIFIEPKISELQTKLDININYSKNGVVTQESLIKDITLPIDIKIYDSAIPVNSIFTNSYYNNSNIFIYSSTKEVGSDVAFTKIVMISDIFSTGDYLYINNFICKNITTNKIVDFSGVYKIETDLTNGHIIIELDTSEYELISILKISYYKGWKIHILRVGQSNGQLLKDRYLITKELL